MSLVPAFRAPLVAQQIRSSVVLGGVKVRYADSFDLSAVTLSPAVTMQSRTSILGANATLSQPDAGSWSAQALLSGARFLSFGEAFAAEVGANAGSSSSGDGNTTAHGQGLLRAHLIAEWWGAWVGGGVGGTKGLVGWRTTKVGEAGLWTQWNAFGAVASWSPIDAGSGIRYTDATVSLRWRGRRAELDGTMGSRSGGEAITAGGANEWVSASGSYRLTDRFAVVLSGGTYPVDLLQGFPSGRFASFGVRVTGPGRGPSSEFARRTDEVARDRLAREGVSALQLRRVATGRYELRIRASGAGRVEVTGDLTGWEATAMQAEPDGWWRIVLEGAPGLYELTVRRDAGAWLVPPGLVERRDEFGGTAGLVRLR